METSITVLFAEKSLLELANGRTYHVDPYDLLTVIEWVPGQKVILRQEPDSSICYLRNLQTRQWVRVLKHKESSLELNPLLPA